MARSGMWGISYPGFYTAAGMIDAHPALKAVSPQAPIGDWFVGDDWHHNGAFFLAPRIQFPGGLRPPSPEPTQEVRRHVRPRHTRRLRVLPRTWDRSPTPTRSTSRANVAFWNEMMAHGDLRRVLEEPQSPPAPEEHPPRRADRGRLVRRREPVRRPRDLQQVETTSPGTTNILVMGPWVTAAGPATTATPGPSPLQQPRRPCSSARRSSSRSSSTISRAKGDSKLPEALGLRDRHEPVAAVRRLAAQAEQPRSLSSLPAERWAVST